MQPHPKRQRKKLGTVRMVLTACCEHLVPIFKPALPPTCPECGTLWHGRKRRMTTIAGYARNAVMYYDYEPV